MQFLEELGLDNKNEVTETAFSFFFITSKGWTRKFQEAIVPYLEQMYFSRVPHSVLYIFLPLVWELEQGSPTSSPWTGNARNRATQSQAPFMGCLAVGETMSLQSA